MPEPGPDLAREAAAFGRYLMGREPAAGPAGEAALRYAEGCRRLFPEAPPPADGRLVAFATRHPWTLPFLDAACGAIKPRSGLRQKLILMLAVLETMPEQSAFFLPEPRPRAGVLLGLARAGVSVALKVAAGTLLLPVARWSRGGDRSR